MTHPRESQLLAFLEGDLSPAEAAVIDSHLLACESCWQAVTQDRRGRQVAESVRVMPSPDLRDRVRLAVELSTNGPESTRPTPSGRPHWRKRVATGGVIVGLAAVSGTLWGTLSGSSPSAVAAVVQTARTLDTSAPLNGRQLRSPHAAQPLRLEEYEFRNSLVVVAVSPKQFPMPKGAVAVAGNSVMTWTATEDGVNLYCINGDEPTLFAGSLPSDQLGELASQILHG